MVVVIYVYTEDRKLHVNSVGVKVYVNTTKGKLSVKSVEDLQFALMVKINIGVNFVKQKKKLDQIFCRVFFTFTRTANAPRTMSEAQTPTEIAEDTFALFAPQTDEADDERKEAVRALKDLERKYPMLKEFREEEAVEYKVIPLKIPMISTKTFEVSRRRPGEYDEEVKEIFQKSADYHKKFYQQVLDDYKDFHTNTLNKLGAEGWTLSHIQRPQPGEKHIITNVRGKWKNTHACVHPVDVIGEWDTYKTELPHYYIFTRSRSKANKEDQLTEMLGKLLQKLDDK